MTKEEFPKTLHHPHFRKGGSKPVGEALQTLGGKIQDYQGEPDLFPDVIVNNGDQEAFYRAKGYLGVGESLPVPVDYAEYPVMLSHQDHRDAIPDDFDIKKGPGGEVISTRIPGSPEKMPPVMAKNADEEKGWAAKGYRRIGVADGDASARAKASPYDPDYKVSEYPKMVDGIIVDPHATMEHNRYPMYVGNLLVNSPAEEKQARASLGQNEPAPAENCIICGKAIEDGEDYQNGAAGPLHTAHLGGASVVTGTDPTAPVEAPKAADRSERGRKAAETRRLNKERAGQAASNGG